MVQRNMSRSALIVTDMLNRYEHEDADQLIESVRDALPGIRVLIEDARDHDVLVVYVNDNREDWSAGRDELVERAMSGAHPELVKPIAPDACFSFVVEARHSVFYETQLDYMLRRQEIKRLVLAGQVTEQCILYSALDAYVRHYEVVWHATPSRTSMQTSPKPHSNDATEHAGQHHDHVRHHVVKDQPPLGRRGRDAEAAIVDQRRFRGASCADQIAASNPDRLGVCCRPASDCMIRAVVGSCPDAGVSGWIRSELRVIASIS
jgi:nicotinamidase-related amidase